MMTGAASGRSVLARWDGDGIELEGPSDVMTPENLSILSNYKPIIEAEARQRAGEWVALHELHELYELHFLLYGVDRKKKSPSFSSSCEVHKSPQSVEPSGLLDRTDWQCPAHARHRDFWVSDFGLKICTTCHPDPRVLRAAWLASKDGAQ